MSKIPRKLRKGYWRRVKEVLVENYQLMPETASAGVRLLRRLLKKHKVGDMLYHAPIDDTAEGVLNNLSELELGVDMPYIKTADRVKFEACIEAVPEMASAGELNYLLTNIALKYMAQKGKSYATLNDIAGAFTNANLEFYRKVVSNYEDGKACDNGEVYPQPKVGE